MVFSPLYQKQFDKYNRSSLSLVSVWYPYCFLSEYLKVTLYTLTNNYNN